jgi:hypothetical protein
VNRDEANGSRFARGDGGGFYESWFSRANHPKRRLALWTRSTIFSPRGAPERAVGEVWAIWFDGERDRIVAAREEHPVETCRFAARGLDVRVGDSVLVDGALSGSSTMRGHRLAWELRHEGADEPLLLLPPSLYGGPFPKTKSVTGSPGARFFGTFDVDGESFAVDGWPGAQAHNWGTSQTDEYAWAQIAGFDGAEGTFLECITGRVSLVRSLPIKTPWSTLLVMRHAGREVRVNAPTDWVRTRARYALGDYEVRARREGLEIALRVTAPKSAFVGLTYADPKGGSKICHNTKLGRAELVLREGGRETRLVSEHGAALEILADRSLGVHVAV